MKCFGDTSAEISILMHHLSEKSNLEFSFNHFLS